MRIPVLHVSCILMWDKQGKYNLNDFNDWWKKINKNKVVFKNFDNNTFIQRERERERCLIILELEYSVFQAFVGVVQANMAVLEECVNKAEDEMGSLSGLKKMLSSFVGPVSWWKINPNLLLFTRYSMNKCAFKSFWIS